MLEFLFGWMTKLDAKDWTIVCATISGPILAVQAQKWVERYREIRERKAALFTTLMATRAERLSTQHVRALNGIEVAFYGRRALFGSSSRSTKEQVVLDAWKSYLHHVGKPESAPNWYQDLDRHFLDLLSAIAADVGYRFDRVQLETGSYFPVLHSDMERAQRELLGSAAAVFSGKRALKMDVVSFPPDWAAAQSPAQPDEHAPPINPHEPLTQLNALKR